MRNLFDFSDAQMSWRSCPNFNMDLVKIDDTANVLDDEESWFFPCMNDEPVEKVVDINQKIDEDIKRFKEFAPIIYISGMDLNCQLFEKVPINLADFKSYEEFMDAFPKCIYFSIFDTDNCDYDKVKDSFPSEELFYELLDEFYKSYL